MFTLKFHNDVKFTDIDVPYKTIIEDKAITTGYTDFVKMEDWTKKLKVNDTVIVRLLSVKRAEENPDKTYLLKCKCVNKGVELLGNLDKHMESFIPDIQNPNTLTSNNRRHEWFDIWNANTKVFCVKIDNITETYTYNELKDVIKEEQYKDFKTPFKHIRGKTFICYKLQD
tara:strand:- start:577 stop:1089 length:513 start_codon:yes stop_codon:yes gene_type:complete